MAASPAQVIAQFLTEFQTVTGPGLAPTPDMFPVGVGPLPPDGSNFIACMDTGAFQQGRIQNTGERVKHPFVQIIVRSIDYPTGWQKGQEIEAALDAVGIPLERGGTGQIIPVKVGDDDFALSAVHVLVELTPVGQEPDTRRHLFTVNTQVQIKQTTPDNYKRVYGQAAMTDDDELLGFQNGYLTRFPPNTGASIPIQIGHDGELLSTDGTDPLWTGAPTVESLTATGNVAAASFTGDGSGLTGLPSPGSSLPDQVGQTDSLLTTDGTTTSWTSTPVVSQLTTRSPGGTPGTQEVQLYHDGDDGYLQAMSGRMILGSWLGFIPSVWIDDQGTLITDQLQVAMLTGWYSNSDCGMAGSAQLKWGAGAGNYTPLDTGLARQAAGVLKVTNGASGSGTLTAGKITAPGSATGNSAEFGTLGLQSYAVNNCWLSDNLVYDGTDWRYRTGGTAVSLHLHDGSFAIENVPSGSAGSSAYLSQRWRINANGSINIGAAFTPLAFVHEYNGSGDPTLPVHLIQGYSGQTGDLQQWHDGTNIVARVNAAGAITTPKVTSGNSSGSITIATGTGGGPGYVYFQDIAGNIRASIDMASGSVTTVSKFSLGGGGEAPSINGNGLDLIAGTGVVWRPGQYGAFDTGIVRMAPGIVKVTDGSTGSGGIDAPLYVDGRSGVSPPVIASRMDGVKYSTIALQPASLDFARPVEGLSAQIGVGPSPFFGLGYGSIDVTLARSAAGAVKITDGSTGFGSLRASGVANRQVLSADLALTLAAANDTYQLLDAGSASRNVALWASPADGNRVVVKNVGAANNLVVKDFGGTTLKTLTPGQLVIYLYATVWEEV